ncbi:ATP-dependent DNA helicase [Aquincola sp. S2]|uniref:ATP-dependent DNA helicase n=1 Tax=Pseudaquabacterium terrae TaxID=2732868 RepID=A0ABX2EFF7_9BURK|nr:ATP-dependent DNA helicase [Aquabacterium terrae]NRF67331.1 ATP-dependent DNA helicase [Aquabacterium terrae]
MPAAPAYTVAVRALCEFAARRGDLDHRFTPSPTADEGMAGHQAVARRRGPGYRAEVPLQGGYKQLLVRGRADGIDDARELLEEIKTFRGPLEQMPPNHRELHWAQAKVYAWLHCAATGAAACNVGLVYFDIDRQAEAPALVERFTAEALQRFFAQLCECFLLWAESEMRHRTLRDAALRALTFAHGTFRVGQRELAEAVFVAARRGRCVMAQAPTGIGKTIGTIFPLLKAMPEQALDKLFFLTAKGSGRAVVFDALRAMRGEDEPAPRLRVIELVARDKACEHPDKACHGESCPLAQGFYDRLPQARSDAVQAPGPLSAESLREIARRHRVCPYYLGQELARWCDVIVGDYNHYFDVSALLFALTQANGWRVAVLVDEAHNLVDRARACYTAALEPPIFDAARRAAPPALKKALARLLRVWNALGREDDAAYRVLSALPARFDKAVRAVIDATGTLLASSPQALDAAVMDFYFALLHFVRLHEVFDEAHSLLDVTRAAPARRGSRRPSRPSVCLRNVIPAPFVKPRLAAARTAILFSATLTPMQYYAETLGVPADAARLDVPSPYSADQLAVRIVPTLSTRYGDRPATVLPIAHVIARQLRRQRGNYLAFFSSHDYMEQAADAFIACYPDEAAWRQQRRMDECERAAFLERFVAGGHGIGFAVLGGVFAEGIDLPGTRLIGAFITTLGLPQVNPVNEALRQRLDRAFGAGFEYVYLYPGLRKVVQAAGRVLRSPTDVGSIHLIDGRFCRPAVRQLLPSWWRVEVVASAGAPGA